MRESSRSTLVLSVLVGALVAAGVLGLGIWWVWSNERSQGSTSLPARVLLVAGIVLIALLLLAAVGALLTKLPEGNVRNLVSVVVVAALAGGSVVAYRGITRWADQPGPVAGTLGTLRSGGAGVREALPLRRPPFHVIVVGGHGEEIEWSQQPAGWRAPSVSDTELVACVALTRHVMETCHYVPQTNPAAEPQDVNRYLWVAKVRVLAARSAHVVDRFTIRSEPRLCRKTESAKLTKLEHPIAFEQLSRRLAAVIRTGHG